ncbi:excalibur calcium-binding domain-containing protein [Streptomyces sp. NBC_01216]|uniref:excalibur calcium-binding domain-containing protein n=1 Tax=unclassified Streptomyces TaxID=2593676 RepID=UPI002E0ECB2C|nr:excalibur calcium-binding domain-containing protein [Streptomyces sp. NBC_01216]
MSRVLRSGCALVLALGSVAAGVSGCGSSGADGAGETGAIVTATRTVTAEPPTVPTPSRTTPSSLPPSPSSKPTPPESNPSRPSAPRPADAASTVEAYFAAINARDYRRAWELGGRNLGGSYESFRAGFADTVRDTVRLVDVRDGKVTVVLDALQADGTVRSFAGTYTVRGGVIVGADVRSVEPTPETPEGVVPTRQGDARESYPPGPPPGVPDVDCSDLPGPVVVGPSDPHRLDRDGDGIGCEPE